MVSLFIVINELKEKEYFKRLGALFRFFESLTGLQLYKSNVMKKKKKKGGPTTTIVFYIYWQVGRTYILCGRHACTFKWNLSYIYYQYKRYLYINFIFIGN